MLQDIGMKNKGNIKLTLKTSAFFKPSDLQYIKQYNRGLVIYPQQNQHDDGHPPFKKMYFLFKHGNFPVSHVRFQAG